MRKILVVLFGTTMLLQACSITIDNEEKIGNGNTKTITKSISNFCVLQSNASIDVEVIVDKNRATSCDITAEENILKEILVENKGEELLIDFKPNTSITTTEKLKVTLYTPCLKRVVGNGSGTITVNGKTQTETFEIMTNGSGDADLSNIEAAKLIATTNGSGTITIEGKGTNADILSVGSGDVDASKYYCADVTATCNGSGTMNIVAEKTLDAKIEGSGDVNYTGSAVLRESISGSGTINKK